MRWDNEVEDWQGYLPGRATYSEYTRPILEVAEHTPADINVYYRDQFNEWAVNTGGSINVAGMRRFYSDPLGMFARFRAFELGPENCFSRVIKMGKKRHAQQEYHWLYNEVYNRIGRNVPLCVLDHGCGHGRDGIAFMRNGWHVAFVDYKLPSLEMLLDMARRNYDSHADETHFLGLFEPSDAPAYAGRYHVVVSQDVLEHCLDPIAELRALHGALHDDGLLVLGTFFNSCNGQDPQHLEEHAHYQDTSLWFAELERVGFKLAQKDANGVERIWRKI